MNHASLTSLAATLTLLSLVSASTRNTLLFMLLVDDGAEDRLPSIWNVFYHMMLDENSLSLLIEQCRKLVPLAESLDSWRRGPYAHVVNMCDSDTLSEIDIQLQCYAG
ncbi:hypothetical protein F5141DRAFT_1164664 [Pisolithus sp. B1]|nr:hypothetical protein F5141DRAFT_1164664 [Pisolithus sp. B1]